MHKTIHLIRINGAPDARVSGRGRFQAFVHVMSAERKGDESEPRDERGPRDERRPRDERGPRDEHRARDEREGPVCLSVRHIHIVLYIFSYPTKWVARSASLL